MTTRGYGAKTPRELLERARYEVAELASATASVFATEAEAKHAIGSRATACAGTLWNLVDWLANSTDPATKAALSGTGLATHEAIRDHVKRQSPELTLCWELTNGAKHYELKGYTKKVAQINDAGLSVPAALPSIGRTHSFVAKVKLTGGVSLKAVDVYQKALAFWDSFFKSVGI